MGNYGVRYTCEAVHSGLASYLGFQKLENFPQRTSFSTEAHKVPPPPSMWCIRYTCEAVHSGLASYLGFQKLENFPQRTSFSSEAHKVPINVVL